MDRATAFAHLHVEPGGSAESLLPGFERLRASAPAGGFPWFLDSALEDGRLGRFSFAGVDPWGVLRAGGARGSAALEVRREAHPHWPRGTHALSGDAFAALGSLLERAAGDERAAKLPFAGGAVGYFGYELAEALEDLTFPSSRPTDFPDLCFLLVDAVVAFDHERGELWLCGTGFGDEAKARAQERVRALRKTLAAAAPPADAARKPVPTDGPVEARHDADSYAAQVRTVLSGIERGDLYQGCLTHRISRTHAGEPWPLYRRLREVNPAPFGAYLELAEGAILSSSPERFVRLTAEGFVEARPIKGTRRFEPGADGIERSARALAASEKDRAENVMIVDLYRNDLGRVCETGSVQVPELFAIERYATLHQMVSTVTGRLARGRDALDLVRAIFPPGSMTGAPKIAAVKLLAELEDERRGVYAGALGYLDARGGMDLSVVIRTILLSRGRAHVNVGGGIVADSEPLAEYQEAMDKARALALALAPPDTLDAPEGEGS